MEEDPIMNVSLLIRMCYKELFVMISRTPQFFNSVFPCFSGGRRNWQPRVVRSARIARDPSRILSDLNQEG